jgi:hypothetical protein
MTRIVETKCKACKKPMSIEIDVERDAAYEGLFAMICCDDCMVKMGRMKRVQANLQPLPRPVSADP